MSTAETSGAPRRTMFFAVTGAVAIVLAALGITSRIRERRALETRTREAAVPVVQVIAPGRDGARRELVLPGNVEAFAEAPIYARTSGYLKAWHADIGQPVKKGELLAEIEAPEVDQQLAQARGQLSTATANRELADLTAGRLQKLLGSKAISQQEYDNAVSAAAARHAEEAAARANVARLEHLVAYQRIEAPFDGTITARNTDVGQLVDAGSSGGPARDLFRIASTDRLRVYVTVPQINAASATPGAAVAVTLAERPGQSYPGTIARNARAIDPATRTLLVEVDLDNSKREILPGAYAQVHLRLDADDATLLVPVSALLFRPEGPRVAEVADRKTAKLVPITIGRDYGTQVEVTSGLSPGAELIDNPPDSLVDGQAVRVSTAATPTAKPAAK